MKPLSEQWARKFHDAYERLAPDFGYETRDDTKEFDPQSPNGRLMIAVIEELGTTQLEADLAEATQRDNMTLVPTDKLKQLQAQVAQLTLDNKALRKDNDYMTDIILDANEAMGIGIRTIVALLRSPERTDYEKEMLRRDPIEHKRMFEGNWDSEGKEGG